MITKQDLEKLGACNEEAMRSKVINTLTKKKRRVIMSLDEYPGIMSINKCELVINTINSIISDIENIEVY